MNDLLSLYSSHEGKLSDRWSSYLTHYSRILEPWRTRRVRLLEIGIQNGGSLELWSRFFPQPALLVGCDIDPKCASLRYDDRRIKVVVADASSEEARQQITA
jgi:hypothetical protein